MLKKFLFVKISLLILFTSCGTNNTNTQNPIVEPNFTGNSPIYSGSIANWLPSITGFAQVSFQGKNFGSSASINNDGSLSNLTFPSGDLFDSVLPNGDELGCAEAKFEPSTTKIFFAAIKVLDDKDSLSGYLVEESNAPNIQYGIFIVGDKLFNRVYSNSDAILKGSCTFNNKITIFYDVIFSTGWNTTTLEVTRTSGAELLEAKVSSGKISSNQKLYYVPTRSNTSSESKIYKR